MKYCIIIPVFGKLSHILARFFFHAPIHYKAETKFCASIYKPICIHAHAQTKRPTFTLFSPDTKKACSYHECRSRSLAFAFKLVTHLSESDEKRQCSFKTTHTNFVYIMGLEVSLHSVYILHSF